MKSLYVEELGGPGYILTKETKIRSPKAGEVQIKVRAAGVNYADIMQSKGMYGVIDDEGKLSDTTWQPDTPYIPGLEVCGDVVQVNSDVTSFKEGDRVFGIGPFGAFAEYSNWPVTNLFQLPESWSYSQGAAFFINWATAYGVIHVAGSLQKGETILIHAAAGGVGQAAVQIAKLAGAKVIATASTTEKLEIAKSLGADHTINYQEEDFVKETLAITKGQGVDLVLEMVGGDTFRNSMKVVKRFERLVAYGAASEKSMNINSYEFYFDQSIKIIGFNIGILIQARPDLFQPMFTDLMKLIESNKLKIPQPNSFSLEEAQEVLQALNERKLTGKVVLEMSK